MGEEEINILGFPLVLMLGTYGFVKLITDLFDRLNQMRDLVVGIRNVDGQALAKEYRRMVFRNDWVPLYAFTLAFGVIFTMAVASIPLVIERSNVYVVIFPIAVACILGATCVAACIAGIRDWRLMVKAIGP